MALNLHKNGEPIANMTDWAKLAPPKKPEKHWVDLRSAKELARSFVGGGEPVLPVELMALLQSNARLGAVELSEASPEEQIALDAFRGEKRNADLVSVGVSTFGSVVVTVEAKADEKFDVTIDKALASGKKPKSNKLQRIENLTQALFGVSASEVSGLRYQLLHAVAATLILAGERSAKAAVFVVYEFRSSACRQKKVDRNATDLDDFVTRLGGTKVSLGVLQGPFDRIPGGEFVPGGIPLFIGKAVRSL